MTAASFKKRQEYLMTPWELLIFGSRELGVALSAEQADVLFVFIAELRKWNRKINLTAITAERDVVIKHLLDSLSFLKGFDPEPGMSLLDLGSGAGFPAIPIKIAHPEISVLMVESVKKKASFLRHVIRTLGLSSTDVSDLRAEELPESSKKSYDIVTARAFADMEASLAAGAGYLKDNGLMVLSRGPGETVRDEYLREAGVRLESRQDLTLPYSDNKRALWVFRREEGAFGTSRRK